MQIAEVYDLYKNLPRHELEVLLQFVLKKTKQQLFLDTDYSLTESEQKYLKQSVNLLESDYPLAYITGTQNFYGYDFIVNPSVLIPRPETEVLVEHAIKLTPESVLDIGTGSGCIAISIALNLPTASITAIDISSEALEIANKNAEKFNLELNFLQSNFLEQLDSELHFDLIITNPPYVKTTDQPYMSKSTLLHEPEIALYSGINGLDAYLTMFEQLQAKKISFNYLLGEFGFNQETEITDLLELHFSGKYTLLQDLTGITRFFKINNTNAR